LGLRKKEIKKEMRTAEENSMGVGRARGREFEALAGTDSTVKRRVNSTSRGQGQ